MNSLFDFIVEPYGQRYNNEVKVGDKSLIINTKLESYKSVNNIAKVISVPLAYKTPVKPGDLIIIHHNVFRRWYNVKGKEKNSRAYIDEDHYLVQPDQIFLHKPKAIFDYHSRQWQAQKGYCFVAPLKSTDELDVNKEKPLMGIVKYTDGTVGKGDLIGFRPSSEYEFIIDGQKLYRLLSNFITIKYEYQGDEEEYNPSWTESS